MAQEFDPQFIQQMLGTQSVDPYTIDNLNQRVAQMQPTAVSFQAAKKTLIPQSEFDELQKRRLQSFQEQQKGIQDFETGLQQRMSQSQINPLLAATAGLSDLFAGTNKIAGLTQQKMLGEQALKQDQEKLQGFRKDLTKAETDMLDAQYKNSFDQEKLALSEKLARMKINADAGANLSPYQEAKQKKLGATQAEYLTNDRGVLTGNLEKVNTAIERLEGGGVETGSFTKKVAPGVAGFFDTDFAATKADLESAITDTLRPTLGAAFTAKEGEQIKALTFDPGQPAAENARRARRLAQFIQKKVEFQDAFGSYLDANNGSDAGFPFQSYGMKKVGTEGPQPPKAPLSLEEWRKQGKPKK